MSSLLVCKMAVIQMAEHYVDCAYGLEVPEIAAVHHGYVLHGIRILPQVAVAHYAAVMVAIVLAVALVPFSAEVAAYAAVCEQ